MVSYPALFDPDHRAGGFVVTFPDFAYGVTQGATMEEATDMATDLLACLIADLIEKGEKMPKGSKPRGRKFRTIHLPALQSAKVELYVAFQSSGMRKAELARRLGISKSNVDRLFSLSRHSRLDQIEDSFRALGLQLNISIERAA
jgi:antitoxin HicB